MATVTGKIHKLWMTFIHLLQQIKANTTLMQMVGADWLKSDKREDDLGGRPGGIVQVIIINHINLPFFHYQL